MKSFYFCVGQQRKKNRLERTAKKNRFFVTCKPANFVVFVIHVYVSWWLTCSSSINVPVHNLCLFSQPYSQKQINSRVAEAAIATFNRHTWYLCEDNVPILLYSDKVSDIEKAFIVSNLKYFLSNSTSRPLKRLGMTFEKPVFPILI